MRRYFLILLALFTLSFSNMSYAMNWKCLPKSNNVIDMRYASLLEDLYKCLIDDPLTLIDARRRLNCRHEIHRVKVYDIGAETKEKCFEEVNRLAKRDRSRKTMRGDLPTRGKKQPKLSTHPQVVHSSSQATPTIR